jgi:hypothetical protein
LQDFSTKTFLPASVETILQIFWKLLRNFYAGLLNCCHKYTLDFQ